MYICGYMKFVNDTSWLIMEWLKGQIKHYLLNLHFINIQPY